MLTRPTQYAIVNDRCIIIVKLREIGCEILTCTIWGAIVLTVCYSNAIIVLILEYVAIARKFFNVI